jgi:spoIIIJ-associated protein
MEWVVTTAKTVEEAVDVALDQLGVDESDAEFEVLEEPKGGLFGLGGKPARVRARVRPKKPPAKDDSRDRRNRRSRNGGRSSSTQGGTESGDRESSRSKERSDEPKGEGSERSTPSGRRRGGRGRGGSGAKRPEGSERSEGSTTSSPRSAGRTKENPAMLDELTLDQQSEKAQEFLQGLVGAFGVSATVSSKVNHDDAIVELSVDGEELGLMVGAKGSTLQAVQDLTRTMLQRTAQNLDGLVIVDIASYRAKRREALQKFSEKVHQEVVSNAKQVVLEPMNAADRKVVHDSLADLGGVSTHSEGEEPRRRVVVSPMAQS